MATNDMKLTWPVCSSKRESTAFIQWCECYACCDGSLPMIYLSTDKWMTSAGTCFLCFVQHGARFWKDFWDYFGLSTWKPRKKFSLSYLQLKKEKWRNARQKEFLPTPTRNFHRYERLAVLQNFFAIILLWASEEVERLFRETDK